MDRIPEILLIMSPQTEEAKSIIGFELTKKAGTSHKLGGGPDWVQGDDTPTCSCGKVMTFYGQLDCIGDEVSLGDCGMIYVFVCMDCLETKSVLQCG